MLNFGNVKNLGHKFAGKSHLEIHSSTIHEGKKLFKCNDEKCQKDAQDHKEIIPFRKIASNTKDREENITLIHKPKKPFKCNICKKKFVIEHYLKKHIELKHEGKRFFKCEICSTDFSQKSDLNIHISTIHK